MEIKIGDYYIYVSCNKSCYYVKHTKENYPYCKRCKVHNLNQRSNK